MAFLKERLLQLKKRLSFWTGKIRVATFENDVWTTRTWIKQAILMYFRIAKMEKVDVGPFSYFVKSL